MSLLSSKKEIDLTKLRGKIKIESIQHKGHKGGEYYFLKAIFEDGTSVLIDMQLIELLNLKLHKTISERFSKNKEEDEFDLIEGLMEIVTGEKVRDSILESIYNE